MTSPKSGEQNIVPRTAPKRLHRELGTFGAVMMGLGAMVGTGVFVSLGIAAGIAGPAVVIAVVLAAGIALCNGMSSAQLAAAHPVSGGTYEYGYRYLNSWAGFTAGWVFLIAKSASAATAALGFAGYLLHAFGRSSDDLVPLALAGVVALTVIVLAGIRRTNAVNIAIVSITLASLAFFILAGSSSAEARNFSPLFGEQAGGAGAFGALLEATALMFVAYTGYARIATLGEEVRDPRRTIPKAILLTTGLTMLLYGAVAIVGIGAVGGADLLAATQAQAAPLAVVAQRFDIPFARDILVVGAVTAMLGVLLNLLLGLSRVLLAMARRADMPRVLASLNRSGTTPHWAVIAAAAVIAGLVLVGNIRTTWSFSAFNVLIYYALTNLAALRLPAQQRLYPRWIAAVGGLACLALAFWIEQTIWLAGLGIIAAGLLWHLFARRAARLNW
jgi:APA family basic amino acid/polyamine antiporter